MSVRILFGSQTGTAEDFADQIAIQAKRYNLKADTVDLHDFEADEFVNDKETVNVFVVATHGEGEPTDNAYEFHRWLQSTTAAELKGLRFTVFGLGNTQYEHFNAMARFVQKKLTECEATEVYHYGEGDDDGTLQMDFEEWNEELFAEITKFLFGGEGTVPMENRFEPRFTCTVLPTAPKGACPQFDRRVEEYPANQKLSMTSRSYHNSLPLRVIAKRELRQKHGDEFGSTIHFELDLEDTPIKYKTADNILLFPENPDAQVEAIAKRFGFDLNKWISLTPLEKRQGPIFPSPCNIRVMLKSYCDFNALPEKQLLRQLALFATSQVEQKRLILLSSKEGREDYISWGPEQNMTVWKMLEEFQSLRFDDIGVFAEIMPRMLPRWYTIASSSAVHPRTVHVALSITKNDEFIGQMSRFVSEDIVPMAKPAASKKPVAESRKQSSGGFFSRLFGGGQSSPKAATNVVATIPTQSRIYGLVKPSSFKLPRNATKPIIMVGPGTGIAPMRAFLQQREAQHERLGSDKIGDTILFFGCRNKEQDYIYKNELEQYRDSKILTELHVAFSRHEEKKNYVQHHIKANAERLWKLISEEQASIYVCGATGMGKSVQAAFLSICKEHGNMDQEATEAWLKQMQSENRYVVELWTS